MNPRVTVVVPTYLRPELLDRCLNALCRQDYPARNFEIIVVDDGCSPATREQISCWTEKIRCAGGPVIRYFAAETTRGPAAARNMGWRSARGEVIAFTDDDCVPEGSWLSNGVAPFACGVDGVSGRVVVPLPDQPTDYELNVAHLESSRFLTAACFYRRDALERVGGFDERFETAWREDSDLQYSLRARGYRLTEAPGAVVVHPVRPSPWGVSVSQQRKSMYNALLHKKHPELFPWSLKSGPRWSYYGIVAAGVAALTGFVTKRRPLARLGLLAWLLLTTRFCASRLRGTSRQPMHLLEMIVTSVAIPPVSIFWRIRGAIRYRVRYF